MPHSPNALRHLQRQTIWLGCAWVLLAGAIFLGLRPAWAGAGRWLVITLLAMIYPLAVLWRGLGQNHRPGETNLLPGFGAGNYLTISRGFLISATAGFLGSPWPGGGLAWLPVLFYTAADIADYFDGYLARVNNQVTGLGGLLDMEYDGYGMAVVSILGVWYGQLPAWYLLVGVYRYLFVAGMAWRERRGLTNHEMLPSVHRRVFAGLQMGYMSVVLWPILPGPMSRLLGTIFAGATTISFLRDWLTVAGRLRGDDPRYQRWQNLIYRAAAIWAPPPLRLLLGASLLWLLLPATNPGVGDAWTAVLTGWGAPAPAALAAFTVGWAIFAGALTVLGILGRFAGITLAFPIGFDVAAHGLTPAAALALTAGACLLLLGTGPASLWAPEERWFKRPAGSGA